MQKAEIIVIGTELLSGKTVDTTSAYIGRKLARIGIAVTHKAIIQDKMNDIIKAVKQARKRSSILVITGGLGPTKDDITKKAVARALDLKMVYNIQIEASIRRFYKKLRKEIPALSLKQAYIPEGAEPLKNFWGTAPGIYLKKQNKRLFMLPGVPHETLNMLTYRVLPILSRELRKSKLNSSEINIFGIGESTIENALENLSPPAGIAVSYLPEMGCVKLALSGNVPEQKLKSYSRRITNLFKENVYSKGDVTLEQALGKILKQKKFQLAVAESCTGGLLASNIVGIAGASSYFAGGVIAYSNKIKTNVLGVPVTLIKKYGAVSIPVAKAMAAGVAKKISCHCGIGITGVAGPTGGTRKKPVGNVCIASCCGKKNQAESFQFYGDRSFIRQRAVTTALFQMLSLLKMNV